ncbi:conjugal transfer protein TrbH [Shinella yambaruensis]|uniref:Conjugal transfer protein TrbH n=1 Tax=Shinella yambaruensis TaxID=415996 RepID=A0ABQ5ZX38_9HYPH|nr:conjugal transfer protein TrbH [Shinella yambaruensis]MCJ8029974.1 conjugal transfer protein TrbH [Shinella yambaruensis]MCU7984228.1 conjugal transfer protein TrbH [Shinella yambaruensis]GLR55173.1 hypothetical protein GCM10007923_63950 [Shinella yambaruensis]
MKRLAPILLTASLLAGCATTGPGASYVAPEISAGDATVLATDAARHLAQPLAPAHTTLLLRPASGREEVMTPALTLSLRDAGFGVVMAPTKPQNSSTTGQEAAGTALRYLVSPLDAGVLMRLQYQNTEAARFYPRATNGELSPDSAAPFTVREASQNE